MTRPRTLPIRSTLESMADRARTKRSAQDAPVPGSLVILELQRATHAAGVRLEELLADVGLSQGEAHVIALLADGTAHTVGELQRDLGHRPSTLSGILDRLESRGLIRRALNDADRRSFLISLTRSGQAAARSVMSALRQIEQTALEYVPSRDVSGFHAVARALAERSP
jgi:MarR family transcriptional regulator, organic hydroperoxide resistance regulator